MDIQPLNNDNKFLNKTGKSQSSDQSSRADNLESGSEAKDTSKLSGSDKLQLTNLSSTDEVRFAKTVLQNLKTLSFEQLSEVRDRIQQGEFNTPEVTEQVSSEVASQITFIESVVNTENSAATTDSNVKAESLNDDVKQKLVNNEEVLNNISSRLLDSLLNL